MTRPARHRPAALSLAYVGAGMVALGVLLHVVAGVSSAIDYNLHEQPEGSPTGPTPTWILSLGIAAIVRAAVGVVTLAIIAPVVALASSRRHRAPPASP